MMKQPETISEERKEFMVSPNGDAKPTLRTAHFLKPSVSSMDGQVLELSSHFISSERTSAEPMKAAMKVTFNGWRYPQKDWKTWLDRMCSLHKSTWKKAGIYEAILGSTYPIERNDDLVFGIAERWCSETNTFIFPWGEATITLEDMMVLGGYSVLEHPVSMPLETRELKETEEKLIEVRSQIVRTKAQKASQYTWMRYFMDNENERGLEHEAFLSLWLSRFVLPKFSMDTIGTYVFPISIHLAKGKRIALAPAVLASIYRDLSLLKKAIVASTKMGIVEDKNLILALTLRSPFQLVQIWAWERFVVLRPNPNLIEDGEPRLAKWHKLKWLKLENLRLALDSTGEHFQWRPYTSNVSKKLLHNFYGEKEKWVSIDPGLDRDLLSFARCLRVCELVGIDCIEQYLPHRVAMQFGFDQDLPGQVARSNETPEIAWRSYSKQISNVKLYIPSRLFQADVTTRYLKWWKQSFLGCQGSMKGVKQRKRIQKSSKERNQDNDVSVPPGFPSKGVWVEGGDTVEEDGLTNFGLLKCSENCNSVDYKPVGDGNPLQGTEGQSLSSSTADNETTRKGGSLGVRIMHSEASMGGSERAMEDKNESEARSLVNKKESHASITPQSSSEIKKQIFQDPSDDDDNLLISVSLRRHSGFANRTTPRKASPFKQSEKVVSPASSAAIENSKKRKLSTTIKGSKGNIPPIDGVATEVKRKATDSGNDPIRVAKEVKTEVVDMFDITKVGEKIRRGKASEELVKGAAKEGLRKKAGESSNNPIDVDDYIETARSKNQEVGLRHLDERVQKLEKLFGWLNPE